MMSTEQIVRLSDEAAARAERNGYRPKVFGTYVCERPEMLAEALRSVPNIGSCRPVDWELVDLEDLRVPDTMRAGRLFGLAAKAPFLMVDSSGWGSTNEPSLTFGEFAALVAANPLLGWAIVEVGQFQVVVGAFRRKDGVKPTRVPWAKTVSDLARSFAEGKPAKLKNADTDGVRYRLHSSDIATRRGNVVVFDWCGWYTPTTASHMNEVLRALGADKHVSYASHRDSGVTTFEVPA